MTLSKPRYWVDGSERETVPIDDRGLNYADGLFETILCVNGTMHCESLHLERLQDGLCKLQFAEFNDVANNCTYAASNIVRAVEHTGLARLTITRGSGIRGYSPPPNVKVRWILGLYPEPGAGHLPLDCIVANTRWAEQSCLAGLKLLSRTEQVLAANEAALAGAQDSIMLDQNGMVISSSKGNLFGFMADHFVTPDLERCGIAGTRRRLLIEKVCPSLSIPVEICTMTLEDLMACSELMICNTVFGIIPVASIGNHFWDDAVVSEMLLEKLNHAVRTCDV